MTLQELTQLYLQHDCSQPHDKENCETCKSWKHRFDNPLQDMNGSNFYQMEKKEKIKKLDIDLFGNYERKTLEEVYHVINKINELVEKVNNL